MIHLLRNLLKWFSLFISFLIASLAAIGIAWPFCQGFPSTPASSGSRMAAKSFPLSGCPLWDSQASAAQGLLLGPVPQIPRSRDRSWPFGGRASVGDPLSPRLDFRERMGRLIDEVASDPGRINSAHQRTDSWERLYPDKGTPLMMRVTGLCWEACH